jgi:hypothetical protein
MICASWRRRLVGSLDTTEIEDHGPLTVTRHRPGPRAH